MSNFEAQLSQAIKTYSEVSGLSVATITKDCANVQSATFRIVSMLMFAAR